MTRRVLPWLARVRRTSRVRRDRSLRDLLLADWRRAAATPALFLCSTSPAPRTATAPESTCAA